jgi:hypothetical protein
LPSGNACPLPGVLLVACRKGRQAFNQFFPAAQPHGLVRIGFVHASCRSVDVRKSLSPFNVDADSINKKAAR